MKEMKVTLNFDMDGTIANLYADPEWLPKLESHDPTPYQMAQVMVNMSLLARYIHKLQAKNIEVNIISWLAKGSNELYDKQVTQAKMEWLKKHLPSVTFNNIYIVPYGVPKHEIVDNYNMNYLFDDEEHNRVKWETASCGLGCEPNEIFEVIKRILGA